MRSPFFIGVFAVLFFSLNCFAIVGEEPYIVTAPEQGSFPVAQNKSAANIYVDANDWPGVVRVANDLQADIQRVSDDKATIVNDAKNPGKQAIIIGTIGKSALIDQLIADKKIDTSEITGKWESFLIQVVPQPMDGVDSALVIAGSDKRGTIYGTYDLSEQMGVSPWYYWADVPVAHKEAVYVKAGRYVTGEPTVKYRGIFLNDEAPALSGWSSEKSGGFKHDFYVKVFELLLRLRANYLWPAMWNNCFNEDDPLNPKLADEYGIVMGTSHVEPMMRADKEWNRAGYTARQWNYEKSPKELTEFWKAGLERNKPYENIITVAMRGKIDTPMSETANIELLEKIVADQRKIIADVINPDPTKVPQLWCLYKEVQEYYEKGMRVPDDVTLLWSDDNWGNIRRLPTPDERNRSGGAGVYYHFDYVGGPRNYKWIDTNPIPKIWEQMNLAHTYGADRIWIVNVGDLKPMEFPMEFFLSLAWNPQRWSKEKLAEYTKLWAEREFGSTYAPDIAVLVSRTLKYNGRRKPELLDPTTFSLINYQEADRELADFKAVVSQAQEISDKLPQAAQPAFFQLVLHPAKSYEQVMELYIDAGKNHLYADQGRASANDMADQVKALFKADQDLSDYYNHKLLDGKWDHMMDQVHIGYTNWQQPPRNIIPKVTEIEVPADAKLGVAVEGSTSAWPGGKGDAELPQIDSINQQRRYIDVFNRGKASFQFTAAASDPWILLTTTQGEVDKDQRIWVSVDSSKAPKGSATGTVKISRNGSDENVTIKVDSLNPDQLTKDSLDGFVENAGVVSIEAEHFTSKTDGASAHWENIPDYGRTLSAMSIFPTTAASVTPPQDSPCLQYKMYLFDPKKVDVYALIGPTQAFVPGRGLRLAVSFDDDTPQVVNALEHNTQMQDWEQSVKDSIRFVVSSHTLTKPGYHTLKIWMVDPGVALEKVVVDTGGLQNSYLGPPESFHSAKTNTASRE
jgi:hypothetical protein